MYVKKMMKAQCELMVVCIENLLFKHEKRSCVKNKIRQNLN